MDKLEQPQLENNDAMSKQAQSGRVHINMAKPLVKADKNQCTQGQGDKENNFNSRGATPVHQRNVKASDDCPKGSPHNPVKSAKLSSASFKIHCGGDIPGTTQAINGSKTVERCTHASGSGESTTGIDPKTLHSNPWPPHFQELKAAVPNLPDDMSDPSHKVDCNAMSVKVFCKIPGATSLAANAVTGWHPDVLFDKGNKCKIPGASSLGVNVTVHISSDEEDTVDWEEDELAEEWAKKKSSDCQRSDRTNCVISFFVFTFFRHRRKQVLGQVGQFIGKAGKRSGWQSGEG